MKGSYAMKGKKLNSLLALFLSASILSAVTVSAADTDDTMWNDIENSFYSYSLPSSISSSEDKYIASASSSHKMYRIMYVDTETLDSTEKICDMIDSGSKIEEHMYPSGMVYAVLGEPNVQSDDEPNLGNSSTDQYIIFEENEDSLTFYESGGLTPYNQPFLVLDTDLKEKLQKTSLDLRNTTAQNIAFVGFSTGILFSDEKREYFMPTMETIGSSGILTVNRLYTKEELVNIIRNQYIKQLTETKNSIGEDGNPYTGAGADPSLF